jgi:thiol-disulfide isomerase/thioredoxin
MFVSSRVGVAAACAVVAFWAIAETGTVRAQSDGPGQVPPFPSDPGAWINSTPLSAEALRGKGVFVWFFEETCPSCREKWPSILATAKKFEGQPVIFLAVNSGTPRADVQQYARELNINWPILVDANRQYERQCGVDEISLKNIYQARVISSTGRITQGDWSDIEGTIKNALQGAAWKVDPAEVPATLKSAWLGIEFGNYTGTGASVKKGLTSPKSDVKAVAEKLQAVVQKEIDARAAEAKEAFDQEKMWLAYERYNALNTRFAGYDLPPEVAANRKELAANSQVKAGLVAAKSLESARRLLSTGTGVSQTRATAMLEKIVQDFPGTSLADQASALLNPSAGK